MKSFSTSIGVLTAIAAVLVTISETEARPGLVPFHQALYHTLPSASQQTTVVRDFLGNQGTAYAYQHSNGISASSVAVSRSDNSKTLAYLPAAYPPLVYAHHQYPVLSPLVGYSDYSSYVH